MAEDSPSGLSRTTGVPNAVASSGGEGRTTESRGGAYVTAELPAVPAAPDYGVLLPDGTIWYPGSKERLPAPLLLRVVVWALAFLVLVAAAGDFVVRAHPSWVTPLRNVVASQGSGAGTGPAGAPSTGARASGNTSSSGSVPTSLALLKPQPSHLPSYTTAYSVTGSAPYQVTVAVTGVTWVQAYRLANGQQSGPPLFSGDIQPGQHRTFSAAGPLAVEVAASGTRISVASDGDRLGTVPAPGRVPWYFWFVPKSSDA